MGCWSLSVLSFAPLLWTGHLCSLGFEAFWDRCQYACVYMYRLSAECIFFFCTIRSLASSLSASLAHPFVREQQEKTLQDVCLTLCFISLVLLNACSHLQQTPLPGWDVEAFWFNPICLERQIFFWGFDRGRNWGWSPDLDFLLNITGRCMGNRQLSAFYYPQLPYISPIH